MGARKRVYGVAPEGDLQRIYLGVDLLKIPFNLPETTTMNKTMGPSKCQRARELADGNWDFVFGRFPELTKAMSRAPSQVPDPRGGRESSTKFRFLRSWREDGAAQHNDEGRLSDGLAVIQMLTGKPIGEVADLVIEICGGWVGEVRVASRKVEPALGEEEVAKRREALRLVASRSVLASTHRGAHEYLRGRGLDVSNVPPALRAVDSLEHWEKVFDSDGADDKGRWVKTEWPALLPVFHGADGKPVTFHRIWFKGATKAPVGCPKKLMAPPSDIRGGAIRLDEPFIKTDPRYGKYGVLAVAEGVETALAVRQATGFPTWACYSKDLMEMVKIPEGITAVAIFADKDVNGAGQGSAEKLRGRLLAAGIDAQVFIPAMAIPEGEKGVDWLDVLNAQGASAFPVRAPKDFDVRPGSKA